MCQRDDSRGRGVTFYVHVTQRALVGSLHASGGVSAPARRNEEASDPVEASIINARAAWALSEYQGVSFRRRRWRKKCWMEGSCRWWRALKGIENRIGCASSEWRRSVSFIKALPVFFSLTEATLFLTDGQLKRHPVVLFFVPSAVPAGIFNRCNCRSNCDRFFRNFPTDQKILTLYKVISCVELCHIFLTRDYCTRIPYM